VTLQVQRPRPAVSESHIMRHEPDTAFTDDIAVSRSVPACEAGNGANAVYLPLIANPPPALPH